MSQLSKVLQENSSLNELRSCADTFLSVERGRHMSFGGWEGVFTENEIIGSGLKCCECLICMGRHSRNPRSWMVWFLSAKRKLNLWHCKGLQDGL